MAAVRGKWFGIHIELDHHEVETLKTRSAEAAKLAASLAAGVASVFPPAGAFAGPVAGAIGGYVGTEAVLINFADKGCGVYLTLPWNFAAAQQWWVWVPTTRACTPVEQQDLEDEQAAVEAVAEVARRQELAAKASPIAMTTLLLHQDSERVSCAALLLLTQ
jgi:hypothetical protein